MRSIKAEQTIETVAEPNCVSLRIVVLDRRDYTTYHDRRSAHLFRQAPYLALFHSNCAVNVPLRGPQPVSFPKPKSPLTILFPLLSVHLMRDGFVSRSRAGRSCQLCGARDFCVPAKVQPVRAVDPIHHREYDQGRLPAEVMAYQVHHGGHSRAKYVVGK